MGFNSLTYIWFIVLAVPMVLSLGRSLRNVMLLALSYVFYGWWDWRFLSLLIVSTVVDYCAGIALERVSAPARRHSILGLSILTNLGILGTFKYYDFFAASCGRLLAAIGFDAALPVLDMVLPVGISFYTFQTMSYSIDVYRRRIPAEHNLIDFALFVSFFPQLVAGPIERAGRLLPQLRQPASPDPLRWEEGAYLLLSGFFRKVVVADNLAPFVRTLSHDAASLSGGELVIGFYAMVLFVYADFSGYSDIARGTAKFLGIDLSVNFRAPLFARNPLDFWRRWHITLTEWFRDYAFMPLARLRQPCAGQRIWLVIAALCTFALCGLWHGASWNFVLFGIAHGLILVLYELIAPLRRLVFVRLPMPVWLRGLIVHVFSFHIISLPVVFFIMQEPSHWWFWLNGVLRGAWDAAVLPMLWTIVIFAVPMLLLDFWHERKNADAGPMSGSLPVRLLVCGTLMLAIVLCGATETHEFVYFQF